MITEELYRLLPDQAEGELTRIKSAVVSRGALYRASTRLGLARFAEFARGVGRRNELPVSVIANLVESVIGAIYLDAGYFPAREFVLRHLGEELDDTLNDRGAKNYKSLLQHDAQQNVNATPHYRVVEEDGPHHRKQFTAAAVIGGQEWGRGLGRDQEGGRAGGRPQGPRGLAAARPRPAPTRRAQGRRRRRGRPTGPRRAARARRSRPSAPSARDAPSRRSAPAAGAADAGAAGGGVPQRGRGHRGGADARRGGAAAGESRPGPASASRPGSPPPGVSAPEPREPRESRAPRRPPARPPVDDFAAGLDETLPSRETAARAAADPEVVARRARATGPDRAADRAADRVPDRKVPEDRVPEDRVPERRDAGPSSRPSRRRRRRAEPAASPADARRVEEPGVRSEAAPETAPKPRPAPPTRSPRSADPAVADPVAAAPEPVVRDAPAPALDGAGAGAESAPEPAATPRRVRRARSPRSRARAAKASPPPVDDGFGEGIPLDDPPKAPRRRRPPRRRRRPRRSRRAR